MNKKKLRNPILGMGDMIPQAEDCYLIEDSELDKMDKQTLLAIVRRLLRQQSDAQTKPDPIQE